MRNALKIISSIRVLKIVYNTLTNYHETISAQNRVDYADEMFTSCKMLKEGTVAWWRARCMNRCECIIKDASRIATFIAPSPETLADGGFLGGEWIHTTDSTKHDIAYNRVMDILQGN
jgi:hypothetical protein